MDDRTIVGPPPEWTALTRNEDKLWWQILTGIYREDNDELGCARPAFSPKATRLLTTNGDRDAE